MLLCKRITVPVFILKLIMDYQCIVIYTIVRIAPFYPYTSVISPTPGNKQEGCLFWVKAQIKRLEFIFF